MIDEQTIRSAIVKLFLGGDSSFPISLETDLLEQGICDSLGLTQLAAELERLDPGLRFQDQDITRENLATIEAILSFSQRVDR